MEYKIQLLWDNEASVWVATSTDVPGLVLDNRTMDADLITQKKREQHANKPRSNTIKSPLKKIHPCHNQYSP